MSDFDPQKVESYSLPSEFQIRLVKKQDYWAICKYELFPTETNWLFVFSGYAISIIYYVFFEPISMALAISMPIWIIIIFLLYFFGLSYFASSSWNKKKFKHLIIEYQEKIIGRVLLEETPKYSHLIELSISSDPKNSDLHYYLLSNLIPNIKRPIYAYYLPWEKKSNQIYIKLGFSPVPERKSIPKIITKGLLYKAMILL